MKFLILGEQMYQLNNIHEMFPFPSCLCSYTNHNVSVTVCFVRKSLSSWRVKGPFNMIVLSSTLCSNVRVLLSWPGCVV